MDQRIKELWVEALRSGKYRQCQSRLKMFGDDAKPYHCCLGVLEELAMSEGVITGYDPAGLVLDTATKQWAGLDDTDPRINNGSTLTALNDRGNSFSFIANKIERYL